jgi:hypothetical protein
MEGSSGSATDFKGPIGCRHSGNAHIAAPRLRSACRIHARINEIAARQLGTPCAHTHDAKRLNTVAESRNLTCFEQSSLTRMTAWPSNWRAGLSELGLFK